MYTENANRAIHGEIITQDNLEPDPKNKTSLKTSKAESDVLIDVLILNHLRENPKITQKEMCNVTGLSLRAVQKAFASLQKKGSVAARGCQDKWYMGCRR
ncbi:MAG: winged helix-turn-helix domain-containing protein [Oscillospiraceae bacterium]|nr:winged helix-turn-helix domain-containing protein [Oscillospiraceae bacterium]